MFVFAWGGACINSTGARRGSDSETSRALIGFLLTSHTNPASPEDFFGEPTVNFGPNAFDLISHKGQKLLTLGETEICKIFPSSAEITSAESHKLRSRPVRRFRRLRGELSYAQTTPQTLDDTAMFEDFNGVIIIE